MAGEVVLYRAKLHWAIYIFPVALSLFVIGLPLLLAAFIRAWTSEFAVTNKRVIIKTGLISRKTLELNLHKVESVGVDQSILGRMFGFGTIKVVGTGGTNEPFADIDAPLVFRKAVTEAVETTGQQVVAVQVAA